MRERLAAGLLALAMLVATPPATARQPKVGAPAPDFTLTLVTGEKVSLADLKGRVVVLNFWATWCGPCRKELPLLDTAYRKLEDKGLSVYAITTEGSVPLSKLKELFASMAIPSVRSVKGLYHDAGAIPTNFVIDRSGTLRYAAAGAFDLDALNRLIIPLLNEQPAPPSQQSS